MSPGENGTLFIPVTVPLRLCKRRVRSAYKVYPKWLVYAMVKRTFPSVLFFGDTSKGGVASACAGESPNLSEQGSIVVLRGTVSPMA